MYSVNYHRASSVADAAKLAGQGDAKFLSGGMTLIPAMKARLASPSDLVDLGHIAELKGIKVSGETVTIGAGTTHAEVAGDATLKQAAPAVCLSRQPYRRSACAPQGNHRRLDRQQRPGRRLSGSAAGARRHDRHQQPRDRRRQVLHRLVRDGAPGRRDRHGGEFTAPAKAGYAKFPNPASRYAITGVFVANGKDGVRVAVTGAGESGVFRANEIEAALSKKFEPAALDGVKIASEGLMGDIHATPEYRANLIVVMAKRAVAQANG